MNQTNNPRLKPFAQKLRREMTKEERHLWYDCLKKLPVTFNRQKVIGSYIVDFYCASAKVIIELDGSQHYEENGKAADEKRAVQHQKPLQPPVGPAFGAQGQADEERGQRHHAVA